MKQFALIGQSVQKSLSPAIHSYCFNSLSIDAKYKIIDISSKSQIPEVIELLKNGKLIGINITSPYKQDFIEYIDQFNPRAETIGAINCIHSNDGALIGNNTDWFGFAKSTQDFTDHQNIVILGTGGVVPAIIYYFQTRSNHPIHIIGRSKKKLNSFNKKNISTHNTDDFNLNLKNCLIVNAISSDAKIEWSNLMPKITSKPLYAIDLNYHLKVTKFLNYFNSDVKTKNGLDMLIYQALMSIDIWFNDNLSAHIKINDLKNGIIRRNQK